jgi:hypothetical protein
MTRRSSFARITRLDEWPMLAVFRSSPPPSEAAMHKVFAEIDRVRIAEAERAAEQYRREMRPRGRARLSVSFRRRRETVRLRPATESF